MFNVYDEFEQRGVQSMKDDGIRSEDLGKNEKFNIEVDRLSEGRSFNKRPATTKWIL